MTGVPRAQDAKAVWPVADRVVTAVMSVAVNPEYGTPHLDYLGKV